MLLVLFSDELFSWCELVPALLKLLIICPLVSLAFGAHHSLKGINRPCHLEVRLEIY